MRQGVVILLMVLGFQLFAAVKPADGLWSTADDPDIGSGLMLTTQNDTTLISLFTYSETGENVWYIGSGQVDAQGVLEVDLYQTQNGQNLMQSNPESAAVAEGSDLLQIEFMGSNKASMQINGSVAKIITPNHFGHDQTYGFPDLTGQWAVANLATNQSYVLDLSLELGISVPIAPYRDISFVSSHTGVLGEMVNCLVILGEDAYQECHIGDYVTYGVDIGNDRLVFTEPQTENQIVAVRINQAPNILPNDGHWRTVDDPDVGSGLVMRTQGDYTVVLVYSYDAVGKPEWKIASGQFDENGLFSAELLKPFAGSSIQNAEPVIAQLEPQSQSIEIQMDGLELASLSIDGSEPKMIQNYNFGVELFATENFKIQDEPYQFPGLTGHWLLLNVGQSFANAYLIQIENEPYLHAHDVDFSGNFNARFFGDPVAIGIGCQLAVYNVAETYCTGTFVGSDYMSSFDALFQNLGYRQFKIGTENRHVSGLFIRID